MNFGNPIQQDLTEQARCQGRGCLDLVEHRLPFCRSCWLCVTQKTQVAIWRTLRSRSERPSSLAWRDYLVQLAVREVLVKKTPAKRPLVAVTLWRPWPWAIAHGDKRVENRTWEPPIDRIGAPIAIHGGRVFDDKSLRSIASIYPEIPRALADHPTGIYAVARLARCVNKSPSRGQNRWFSGPLAWVLEDVVALPEVVPCNGAQGIWTVPEDIVAKVREQYLLGRERSSLDAAVDASIDRVHAHLDGFHGDTSHGR